MTTFTRQQGDVKPALVWRPAASQHGTKGRTVTTQAFTITLPGPIDHHRHPGRDDIPRTILEGLLRKLKISATHIRRSFPRSVKQEQ
ncbi:hypothetical protein BGZ97_002728 [Linnemannia gamsii]|uniref:Uncharacterized protein n=1 Tax=Linnemannia gamsii TaxID=64522 RepID=A0A9P6UH39_9FUNG|nr:hypothetical protein BGZ97_002728 [Linnemannia gamsii]